MNIIPPDPRIAVTNASGAHGISSTKELGQWVI